MLEKTSRNSKSAKLYSKCATRPISNTPKCDVTTLFLHGCAPENVIFKRCCAPIGNKKCEPVCGVCTKYQCLGITSFTT